MTDAEFIEVIDEAQDIANEIGRLFDGRDMMAISFALITHRNNILKDHPSSWLSAEKYVKQFTEGNTTGYIN